MPEDSFEQLIIDGIKGLPQDALMEIADFIYFIRKKMIQPQVYEEELRDVLLGLEMNQMDHKETIHLEQEFIDYDKKYPRK